MTRKILAACATFSTTVAPSRRRGLIGLTGLIGLMALMAAGGAARGAEEKPLPKELPPFGADQPLPVPRIEASRLPGGLTVWLVPRSGYPKTTARLAVRGGTASDPRELPGLSELLASAVVEGTATRDSKKLREELQAVGGEIRASASKDAVFVTVTGLAAGTPRLLSILADVARHASFPAAEVELAKTNARQALELQASTPRFLARKVFARQIYGDHPYRVIALEPETIAATTPEILEREYARRFRPEAALLVVVGSFDAAATSRAVASLFSGWQGAASALADTPEVPQASARRTIYFVDRPGSVQSELVVGRTAVKEGDPDYYPCVVANTVFGGAFGSRLVKNLREEKGYTYSPFSNVSSLAKSGTLLVSAAVRNEVTAPSLLEIVYELDRMGATAPTAEELATAKRYQTGLYLIRNQVQTDIAALLATEWVNGLPPQTLGEFVPKVNAVTAADVQRVGRKYFASAKQTMVVVGEAAKVKADLEQFGPTTDVKP